ncbi:hypothetical protein H6P81_020339 [Aristolochia fimbriata]|uniref:CHCH domain-containing protein n=1 Tax=Aristolochia fimbriata TaxID=158543 RepID=A0AAV7DVB0_ARIFI|nr:hypothetical protein H6P81_020339 [Aristolochia fimbriata]
MPRRSSGGFRPAPRAAPVRNPRPPQPATHAPPAPVQRGGGFLLGDFFSSIVEGMGFGVGDAVAQRAMDAVMGPRTIQYETVVREPAAAAPANSTSMKSCGIHSKAFQDCVNANGSDISKCQFYLDRLNKCRRSGAALLGA